MFSHPRILMSRLPRLFISRRHFRRGSIIILLLPLSILTLLVLAFPVLGRFLKVLLPFAFRRIALSLPLSVSVVRA